MDEGGSTSHDAVSRHAVPRAVLRGQGLDEVLALVTEGAPARLRADDVLFAFVTDEGLDVRGCRPGEGRRLVPAGCDERRALDHLDAQVLGEAPGRELLGAPAAGPALLLPARADRAGTGPPTGLLAVLRPPGGDVFGDEDVRLAGRLATDAAVATELVTLRAARDGVCALEERNRISRELHDGVVQSLFAVGLTAQSLRELDDLAEVQTGLGDAVRMVDAAISSLRAYIFGTAAEVAPPDLRRSLRETAAGLALALPELTLELDDEALVLLEPHSEDVVQVVREALTNAARHSGATRVLVCVARQVDGVVVEVRDNGRGIGADRVPLPGHGLSNLRARARRMHAGLSTGDAPGGGCSVRMVVPVGDVQS